MSVDAQPPSQFSEIENRWKSLSPRLLDSLACEELLCGPLRLCELCVSMNPRQFRLKRRVRKDAEYRRVRFCLSLSTPPSSLCVTVYVQFRNRTVELGAVSPLFTNLRQVSLR